MRRGLLLVGLFPLASTSIAQGTAQAPAPGPLELGGVDVPLERLPDMPTFSSSGGSFLDYDRDGWVDYFTNSNGGLWRNENGGTSSASGSGSVATAAPNSPTSFPGSGTSPVSGPISR